MSDAADAPQPSRGYSLRTVIALMILPLLLLAIAAELGAFDGLIKKRFRFIAQKEEEYVNTWMGVPILQYGNDLIIYQNILTSVKPDVVIEAGTFAGGLTLFMAEQLEVINPKGKVITIDIDPKRWKETLAKFDAPGRETLMKHITFIEGSSTAPEVVAQVKKMVEPGQKVLIILDSLHTREHVAKELESYADLVTPGSYVIVNDTHLEQWYNPQIGRQDVLQAVKDFVAANPKFVVDPSVERYTVSCSPSGFLRRQP